MNKKISILTILAILCIGIATAVLVENFGSSTTTVSVAPGIVLSDNGVDCTDNQCTAVATGVSSGTYFDSADYTVTSNAIVDAPIVISTQVENENLDSITVYILSASGTAGTENRIVVNPQDINISTLNDIEEIEFIQNVLSGYAGHVDIKLDLDGDGVYTSGIDDALVIEIAKVDPSNCEEQIESYPTGELVTLGRVEVIQNSTSMWLTSRQSGPNCELDTETADGKGFYIYTLEEWKQGRIADFKNITSGDWAGVYNEKNVSGDSKILSIEFEIDNWIRDIDENLIYQEIELSNIEINGEAVNQITLEAGETFDFFTETFFPVNYVGDYNVISSIVYNG